MCITKLESKMECLYDTKYFIEGHAKVFLSFINALMYYMLVVIVDGIFLADNHKYKFFITYNMDGAYHIVPLAFAYSGASF